MMFFSLERAIRRILINKKIYAFIILEIIVGMSFVIAGFFSVNSADKRLGEYTELFNSESISIDIKPISDAARPGKSIPISKNEYDYIAINYDVGVSFFSYVLTNVIEHGEFHSLRFLCVTDDIFQQLFGFDRDAEKAYVSEKLEDIVSSSTVLPLVDWLTIESGELVLNGKTIENYSFIDMTGRTIINQMIVDSDIALDDVIILPMSYHTLLERVEGAIASSSLKLNGNEHDVEEIIKYLNEAHAGEWTFGVSFQYYEMSQSMEELQININIFSWVAWFSLLITAVGIIGIMFIFISRRKREFAVSISVGATPVTLIAELFIEVFTVCVVGGIFAYMVAILSTPWLSTALFTVQGNWQGFILMLLIVLVITTASCLSVSRAILKLSPIKVLGSL